MNFYDYSNFGDLLPRDPQDGYEASKDIIGECEGCGEEVTAADAPYTDSEGNLFCSGKCAIEYNGIKKMKRDDIYRFRERRVVV